MKQSVDNRDRVAVPVVVVIVVVVEGIVVVTAGGEVWGGLSGAGVVAGELLQAVAALLSNTRLCCINTSRRRVEPAVLRSRARSRW